MPAEPDQSYVLQLRLAANKQRGADPMGGLNHGSPHCRVEIPHGPNVSRRCGGSADGYLWALGSALH